MIRHGGPTGPAPLGWEDDRYDPGGTSGSIPGAAGDTREVPDVNGGESSAPLSGFEAAFWGDCGNTYHEEQKQIAYATRMGLRPEWGGAHPPTFDLGGRSVMDMGGGPVSLLLKCVNRGGCVVIDPGKFPAWVAARYEHCGIMFWNGKAEELDVEGAAHFDETWIYNALQHVDDPAKVIANARALTDTIRIFEWVDVPAYDGHPHELTTDFLNECLGAEGYTVHVDESGAVGRAYYGVFRTT